MPWLLLMLSALLVTWVLWNLSVRWHFRHLDVLLERAGGIEHAPQDLIDRWQGDGGQLTFAFLFGWVPGVITFLISLPMYALAWRWRTKRKSLGANAA